MNRSKILFLSECTPDPNGTGWEQRAFSFLKAYSRCLNVELWFQPSAPDPGLKRLLRINDYYQEALAYYPEALTDNSNLAQKLAASLTRARFVHVFKNTRLLDKIDHPHIYWDLDELPWFARDPRRNSHLNKPEKCISVEEKQQFHRCLLKAEMIFVSSDVEDEGNIPQLKVISNVVQTPAPVDKMEKLADNPLQLLFVGSMNHEPNLDGLEFFTEQILPLVKCVYPELRLAVVGRSPIYDRARKMVTKLQQTDSVDLYLNEPSLDRHYRHSYASIAPIRFGGGTRIKIIESLAYGCPVVSTSIGCEGIPVRHRKETMIADRPEDFAEACISLAKDETLRGNLASNGHALFMQNNSQQVLEQRLLAEISNT